MHSCDSTSVNSCQEHASSLFSLRLTRPAAESSFVSFHLIFATEILGDLASNRWRPLPGVRTGEGGLTPSSSLDDRHSFTARSPIERLASASSPCEEADSLATRCASRDRAAATVVRASLRVDGG